MSSTYPSFSVPSMTSSSFVFLFLPSVLAILRGTEDNGYLSAASKLTDFSLVFVKDNKLLMNFYYSDFVVLLDFDCFQSFAECFIVVLCYCCLKWY